MRLVPRAAHGLAACVFLMSPRHTRCMHTVPRGACMHGMCDAPQHTPHKPDGPKPPDRDSAHRHSRTVGGGPSNTRTHTHTFYLMNKTIFSATTTATRQTRCVQSPALLAKADRIKSLREPDSSSSNPDTQTNHYAKHRQTQHPHRVTAKPQHR